MQPRINAAINFTMRESGRLQLLYRTRKLVFMRRSSQANLTASAKNANAHSTFGTTYNSIYSIYGSRSRLSPSQRGLLRAKLNRTDAFKGVSVKMELFSTTLFHAIRAFSSLRELAFLLKGSVYKMNLSLSSKEVYAVIAKSLTVNLAEVPPFFKELQTVQFSEERSRDFSPFLVFASTCWGALVPRRYGQMLKYSATPSTFQDTFLYHSTQVASPGVYVFCNVLHKLKS